MWYLCQFYNTTPDDERIRNMNPVQQLWMFENWLQDKKDEVELTKNHAYLVASFWNPEAVKQITGGEGGHISTEEEFDESSNMINDPNMNEMWEDIGKQIGKVIPSKTNEKKIHKRRRVLKE